LKLPKLNGFEVLKRIQTDERRWRPPVIIFSSSNAEEGLINSFGLGANSYNPKPVDLEHYLVAAWQVELLWLAEHLTLSPVE